MKLAHPVYFLGLVVVGNADGENDQEGGDEDETDGDDFLKVSRAVPNDLVFVRTRAA